MTEILVTLDPHSTFVEDIAAMNAVMGIRFNTAMRLEEPIDKVLTSLNQKIQPKDLWIDLKCRQLRLVNSPTVPPDDLKLNHRIKVHTPTELRFKELVSGKDGSKEIYRSVEVEKVMTRAPYILSSGSNKIRLKTPPGLTIRFGYGSAVSIEDPSLKIYGYLTKKDKELVKQGKELGFHRYMISFTHKESDINDVLSRDPKAEILAKIEDEEGVNFVEKVYPKLKDRNVHLIAARGDMYEQLGPFGTLEAVKKIAKADPKAVAASRFFPSLSKIDVDYEPPACSDVFDVAYLRELGYDRFLLGDELCYDKERLKVGIGLLNNIAKRY